jgi:protein-glutamine gamma-glutamyltransferase
VSRATAFPVLVVIALYGVVAPSPVVAGILALASLVPLVVAVRVRAALAAQLLLGAAIFASVITVMATLLERQTHHGTLRTPWAAFAAATLALAVSRFYLAKPAGGDPVTLAVALAALTACGGAETELLYPVAVLLFVVTAALARRAADPGRAPWSALWTRRHAAILGALAGIGAIIAGAWIVALPPLHQWVVHQIMRRAGNRVGFSDRMWLGSMSGLLESDRKILRVYGEGVDHLRGVVYSRYHGARWGRAPADRMLPVEWPTELDAADGTIEIHMVEDEPQYYFLPFDTGPIAVSSGVAQVDRSGVLAPLAARPATRIQYRPGDTQVLSHDPPDAGDLEVPPDVRRALAPLALAWAGDADTPAQKLEAIQQHLRTDYRYGLDFERRGGRDPLVEFLLAPDEAGRVGHCEYFATALAVLSRLAGVPSRMVGGFRVEEYNALGGYYIVRERNAHAWVEAYLPERGWTTFDPTPAGHGLTPVMSTGLLGGLVDVFGAGRAGFLNWLDRRTPLEMLGVPLVSLAIPLVLRALWRRRKKRGAAAAGPVDAPLPCFLELSAALARRGVVRGRSETIDQLAARVEGLELADAREGAELLRRYSKLRYGGVGDGAALDRDIGAFCRAVTAA